MLLKCIEYAFNNWKVLLKCKIFPPILKKLLKGYIIPGNIYSDRSDQNKYKNK